MYSSEMWIYMLSQKFLNNNFFFCVVKDFCVCLIVYSDVKQSTTFFGSFLFSLPFSIFCLCICVIETISIPLFSCARGSPKRQILYQKVGHFQVLSISCSQFLKFDFDRMIMKSYLLFDMHNTNTNLALMVVDRHHTWKIPILGWTCLKVQKLSNI